MVHLAVFAQQCPGQEPSDSRRELEAFSKMSAVELTQKYFDHPPYRLFAIRRLIELGDPAVVPVLQRAFGEETEVTRRRFIAAALVSLSDPDGNYYAYVTDGAREAIKSELPFPVPLSESVDSKSRPHYRRDFLEAVQTRGLDFDGAVQASTFELPGAVEALGETGDPRSFSLLLDGLHSPNIMIVRAAAFGLARLQNNSAIQPIVAICSHLPLEERRMIAKSLLYFDSQVARERARTMIADAKLFERWQTEVTRRGWKRAMEDSGR